MGGSEPRAKAILVSGIADKAMEGKIEKLKGKLEEAPAQCTHLVTEAVGSPKRVKYTAKLLAVVALGGRPVVDRRWVDDSNKKGEWLPEDKYIIKDDPKFDFSGSLTRRGRIFEGCHFLRLKDFELPEAECKMVIESGGGSFTGDLKDATVHTIVLVVRGACERAQTMFVCLCVCVRMCECMYVFLCVYICMYAYVCIHSMHTHVCTQTPLPSLFPSCVCAGGQGLGCVQKKQGQKGAVVACL